MLLIFLIEIIVNEQINNNKEIWNKFLPLSVGQIFN